MKTPGALTCALLRWEGGGGTVRINLTCDGVDDLRNIFEKQHSALFNLGYRQLYMYTLCCHFDSLY